ncbi:PAS domain S-box-containing protein [Lutibacter oricola]|uniref:histidine kinase n=1 Tax=Lutibacter oricola TaxID=762486 RepID=A0A1H2QV47_9FLAO|nr:PAS domain S-box protein [Lutibacter oricola]SDW10995.1 PAS domain S-box-containing protein [Lutibacter oricola]
MNNVECSIEKTLDFVYKNGYKSSPQEFLEGVCEFLTNLLNVEYVFINKYSKESPQEVTSIINFFKGKLQPNITYKLQDSPCDDIINKKFCSYPNNVQERFPLDKGLVEMNVESYAGIPLWSSKKEPIGLITIMGSKPLINIGKLESILKIIAIKTEKILEKRIHMDNFEESETVFKELSNLVFEGILIHNGKDVLSVNKTFEKMFGYKNEELVDLNVLDTFFPKEKHEFITKGIAENPESFLFEVEALKKDGSIISLEIQFKGIVTRKNKNLKVCVFRDVTSRKKAEIEKVKLSKAVEQSANIIIITDNLGYIEYTNPKFTELTGYSGEEVLGKNPRFLNSGKQSKEFYKVFWNTITRGETWKGEFQNKGKNGNIFWEQATVTPVKDREGNITNFLAIKEDITAQKISKNRLKNAYKTIENKENFLRKILSTANEGFWIIDTAGNTLDVNAKMCAILGRNMDEIVGYSVFDFVDSNNSKIITKQLEKREKNLSTSYQVELLKPSGVLTPCIFNTSPIYNEENVRVGSLAFVTDISGIKKAYVKLKLKNAELKKLSLELSEKNVQLLESEQKFRSLFEYSPVSTWEVDYFEVKKYINSKNIETHNLEQYLNKNEEFLKVCISKVDIVKVNKHTLNLFGVSSIIELRKLLREKNKVTLLESLKQQFLGIVSNSKIGNSQTKFVKHNGEVIYAIIKSEFGSNGKAIVSVIDITAQKEAEKQLVKQKLKAEKSDDRYRLAVAASGLGIWDWDVEAQKIHYSDYYKKQIGYKPEEFKNEFLTWKNHLHPEDVASQEQKIVDYFKNPKGQFVSEYRFRHKNGSYIWILSTAEVIKNEKGQVIRMFGSHRDITIRKKALSKIIEQNTELIKAKKKAEESNKLKTEFLHNMSHEIRTPMNGILGFSNFLSNPGLSNEKRDYFINIIQNSGNQLLRIIDDILEISRLETKQVKVIEKPVCLNDMLLELFSIFDLKAKENGIPLYLKNGLSDQESTIFTDRSKLNKVLSNLLENALKFTNKGDIKFGYTYKDNSLELFVTDTGIGICKTKQESIFERFSQEEKKLTQSSGGLGLGLSIAKENTELLSGKISVTSQKGVGSTFKILIPYNPVNMVTPISSLSKSEQVKSDKYTVLIVEDEEVNFMFIEILLTEKIAFNFEILHAKNGKEAVDICKSNDKVDFVLMDINMPLLNGYEATKQIRAFNLDVPIIAQTAYSTNEDKEKALNAGCNNFITKPINEKSLKRMIESYLIEKMNMKQIS